MKTPFKYLLFLLIPFLSSCWEGGYDNIPEDQKPELVNNDTLLFMDSLTNKIDSFQIFFSDYYEISDSRYYSELINIFYTKINNTLNYSKSHISQGSVSIGMYINGQNYDKIVINADQTNITKRDITFRGVLYPSTYVLNQYRFDTDTLPKTVYYSLKHGIIRYDYADGRKYELVSK